MPAIAAAHVTKRYTAQATDELTFEVRASSQRLQKHRDACDLPMILNVFDFIVTVRLRGAQVGDIVSVIDMPPKEDTGWWRGKHGFQVSRCSPLSRDDLNRKKKEKEKNK